MTAPDPMEDEKQPEIPLEAPEQAPESAPVEAAAAPVEVEAQPVDTEGTPADETEAQPAGKPQREPPKWEYRQRFRIQEEMKKVVGLAIQATEAELVVLRRKMNKMTYGS